MKKEIRRVARHAALSLLGSVAAPARGSFLRALYFHEVGPDDAENFEELLEHLRREGDFVDTETCLAMLAATRPAQGRYFHLSFDDGHRTLLEYAAPALKRLKIPSLFFVCTSRVGASGGTLTWDDLRKLVSWGFEVGSHTRTHANLARLADKEKLEDEIVGSKRDLERGLGGECKYFAWPFGRKRDINQAALATIERAGYQAGFGAFRGSIYAGETPAFQIPRHHLEADWPWKHVRYFAQGHGESRRS